MSKIAKSGKKKLKSEDQKKYFRKAFLLALNGREGTQHRNCTFENAVSVTTLKSNSENSSSPAVQDAVEICLANDIPITTQNSAGENLMFFATSRCFACFTYLCSLGVDPVTKNTWGVSTLNQACQLMIETGDARILEYLLANKCYSIHTRDDSEQTLLHQAAKGNKAHAVHYLIAMGANINDRDGVHCTPLYYSGSRGSYNALDMLLYHGAKTSSAYTTNQQQESMLHAAVSNPMCTRKLAKRLIFLGLPLKKEGCGCKPNKQALCKKVSPHIRDYVLEKWVEFSVRQKEQGRLAPPSSPKTPKGLKRMFSSSGRSSVKLTKSTPSIPNGIGGGGNQRIQSYLETTRILLRSSDAHSGGTPLSALAMGGAVLGDFRLDEQNGGASSGLDKKKEKKKK